MKKVKLTTVSLIVLLGLICSLILFTNMIASSRADICAEYMSKCVGHCWGQPAIYYDECLSMCVENYAECMGIQL